MYYHTDNIYQNETYMYWALAQARENYFNVSVKCTVNGPSDSCWSRYTVPSPVCGQWYVLTKKVCLCPQMGKNSETSWIFYLKTEHTIRLVSQCHSWLSIIQVLFFLKSSKIQSFLHKGKKSQKYRRDNMHFSYSSNNRIKTMDSDFAYVQCQNIFS